MAERAEPSENRPAGEPEEGVNTLVCLKCGTEYYASAAEEPGRIICEKCGNSVFRPFFSAAEEGEDEDTAGSDFRETTERDLDPDDPEGETMPGDVLDLNLD